MVKIITKTSQPILKIQIKVCVQNTNQQVLSPRFKKYGKIPLGSQLSLGLIYGLSFRIQATSHFPQSSLKIFFLADFLGRNWRIPGFYLRTRLIIEPYSLKPTKVGFIFIGHKSLSRVEDLAAVNHVTKAVVRVGSKIGS